MICWALGISELDPLAYGLYFERFLNPDRVQMPDIDLDFADDRRDEILQYIVDTYGVSHVAHIGTYAKIGAKMALRDVARLYKDELSVPYMIVGNELAGLIPHAQNEITLQDVLSDPESALNKKKASDPQSKKIIDTALQVTGRFRGTGTHAAGVVVANEPMTNICPVMRVKDPDHATINVQTQYEGEYLEQLGLLKLDILGLSELSKMAMTRTLIGEHIEFSTLPEEPDVWSVFHEGRTLGLFQSGGKGMTRAIIELQPQSIEDLALIFAIYRPGPMENLEAIVERKRGAPIESIHPSLDEILEPTYGFPRVPRTID